ncbi:MAG: class I SAM-dependent methyltransferase [Gemmatimonadaceae bacterium]
MQPRQLAKLLLPPVVLDGLRLAMRKRRDPVQRYLAGGRVPWSLGYLDYKHRWIHELVRDEGVLDRFRAGERLAPRYGVGIDERCVEYPWLFAHLAAGPGTLLDAGSILNKPFLIDHPALQAKSLHILTLGPEKNCFWQKGISYLYHDLRALPLRDEFYDTVVCVSTLEHVGLDNSAYTGRTVHREERPADFLQAVHELRRVLKRGGQMLLTVPFGVHRRFSNSQVFDGALLDTLLQALGGTVAATVTYYRYTAEGWNVATREECSRSDYVEWAGRWNEQRSAAPPREPDLAAAARAVACVRAVKR